MPTRQPDPPYVGKARQLMSSKPPQYKAALTILETKLSAHLEDAPYLFLLGQCYERLRHFDKAFERLQQAHNLDPTHPGYLYDMGSCRFNQALFKESLHIWRELETFDESRIQQEQRARISYNRGVCAKELDFQSEAIEALTRAVALAENPQSRALYLFELGGLQLNSHRYQAAEDAFEELKRLSPNTWDFPYYLGVAQLGLNKHDEAEANLLDARRLAPSEYRIPMKLGNLYLERDMPDHAEGFYLEAIEKNPMADEPLRKLSRICRNRGDTKLAEEYGNRFKDVKEKASELTETLRTMRRRVINDPRDMEAHKRRVEILLQYDRRKEADRALSLMLASYPNSDWALLNMAFLLTRGNRHEDALYELDKILVREPDHAFANRDSGRILGARGRMKECAPYLERAVKAFEAQDPPDHKAILELYGMLVNVYRQLRDAQTATKWVEKYKRLQAIMEKGKAPESRPAK